MKKYYATFGFGHSHMLNGVLWDCNVVCCILAKDYDHAREIMFKNFRDKWAFMYETVPDLFLFKRGVIYLNN